MNKQQDKDPREVEVIIILYAAKDIANLKMARDNLIGRSALQMMPALPMNSLYIRECSDEGIKT